jgi:hypothetical protein
LISIHRYEKYIFLLFFFLSPLDRYWKEYEDFEKNLGNTHLAESFIQQFKPKNIHARMIFKDRKRMCAPIHQDRVAVPPAQEGSVVEMQQLDYWNKWIKYIYSKHAYIYYIYIECMLCCLFSAVYDHFLDV